MSASFRRSMFVELHLDNISQLIQIIEKQLPENVTEKSAKSRIGTEVYTYSENCFWTVEFR